MTDSSLEKILERFRPKIKHYALHHLRKGTPFIYLKNLSRVGEEDYDVEVNESFTIGMNTALDYYNLNGKTPSAKFYGVVRGAEQIIRHCYYSSEEQ